MFIAAVRPLSFAESELVLPMRWMKSRTEFGITSAPRLCLGGSFSSANERWMEIEFSVIAGCFNERAVIR